MPDRLDPNEVLDLSIVELSGQRFTNFVAPSARLQISLTLTPVGDDRHQVRVAANVRTFVLNGDSDEDESQPLYEGAAAYVLRFVDNGPDDVELAGPIVVNYMWPYLRMGLIEQASRLGSMPLQLPLEIDAEALMVSSSSSDAEESPAT
jgi:hypothetical protein